MSNAKGMDILVDYFTVELSPDELKKVSTLALAHMGDAVYELLVRSWLIANGRHTSAGLHKASVAMVRADAQAEAADRIYGRLSDDEQAVFRRGRNTRPGSIPKNATHGQYARATALEALFGYLYLTNNKARISELFSMIMEGDPLAP